MRRQQNTTGFNKEKLVFLGASTAFAIGLYFFLSSSPVELVVGKPLGNQSGPQPLANVNAARPLEENFYVVPGTVSRMIDPRTALLVNRERKTPFAPKSDFTKRNLPPPVVAHVNTAPPPPPPPPVTTIEKPEQGKRKKEYGPNDREAEVQYMGVVTINGETYGLLKPKDGTASKRIKVGDKIPDYDYTVTKIDKNSVSLTDKDGRPYVLKNPRFAEEAVLADSGKKDDDEEADPDEKKKPAPKGPQPVDKKDPKAKPGEKTAEKHTEKPGEKKAEKPAEKTAEKTVEVKKEAPHAEPALDPQKMKRLEEILKKRENMKKAKGVE